MISTNWLKACAKEFEDMKKALTSGEVMAYPDMNKTFIVETDTSSLGLGAVLMQEYPKGLRVVEYASKALSSTESKETTTTLKLMVLKWVIMEKFKVYLDKPFIVRTDHQALLHHNTFGEGTPKLMRWDLKLQIFDFKIFGICFIF